MSNQYQISKKQLEGKHQSETQASSDAAPSPPSSRTSRAEQDREAKAQAKYRTSALPQVASNTKGKDNLELDAPLSSRKNPSLAAPFPCTTDTAEGLDDDASYDADTGTTGNEHLRNVAQPGAHRVGDGPKIPAAASRDEEYGPASNSSLAKDDREAKSQPLYRTSVPTHRAHGTTKQTKGMDKDPKLPEEQKLDYDDRAFSSGSPMENEMPTANESALVASHNLAEGHLLPGAYREGADLEGGGGSLQSPGDVTGPEGSTHHQDESQSETPALEGVLAPKPGEARARMLDHAVDAADVRKIPSKTRRLWITIGVSVLIVVVAVGATLGAVLGRKNNTGDTEAPTQTPTAMPTAYPTSPQFEAAASLVESLFGTVLDDPLSPQWEATEWLANVDTTFDFLGDVDEPHFRQRYSLTVLYFATGGESSWTRRSGFLTSGLHECEWFGETLPASNYTLLRVHRGSNGEHFGVSQCSTSPSNPSHRSVLRVYLGLNNLTGTLPDELGELSELQILSVGRSNLEGSIPSSVYTSLSNLEILDLSFNNFQGTLATELGMLRRLRYLFLGASLSTPGPIPSELGQLSDLEHVYLSSNQITGTIPEMPRPLVNLTFFVVEDNTLGGSIPPSLPRTMPNLWGLALTWNDLSGPIPDDIDSLSMLQHLTLADNFFSGTIPQSVANMSSLILLLVENNLFEGALPSNWSRFSQSHLEIFTAWNNSLTGTLPPSLGDIGSLQRLDIFSNSINGSIPTELGRATSLLYLGLDHNAFTGTVPSELVQLTKLSKSYISN